MSNSKLPLVLIPGAMSSASSWTYQLQELTQDRTVIVPERHHRLPTIAHMAEKIAEDLPSECDVVGWSMGGYIACEMYRLAAARIRKLVLISTTARPENDEARRARMALIQAAKTECLSVIWDRLFASAFVHPELLPDELKKRLRADYLALGADTFKSQAEAMMNRRDARLTLASIQCPTLVLVGECDTTTPTDHSAEIAALIPGSILKVIQRAGHNSPLEVPAVLNEHLRHFLDDE